MLDMPLSSLDCPNSAPVKDSIRLLYKDRTSLIKILIFNGNEKIYAVCCCSAIASPSHVTDRIDASVRQLLNEGDTVYLIVQHGAP
ncbi:hypothetical protein NPIL_366041 [Nephila pilipes]|uniref:Uncharacterized protein n=1 Tax=Nephila pilipes TaxID=299642 RepID=A0A8X6PCR3_NEPPI|nr:hypothetical protein NPIL_366041 [Nephila pilipes]